MDSTAQDNNILSPPRFPKTDIDNEDDSEFYFLQPASSPYNMSAKIEEANKVLYAEDIAGNVKQNKVKFKEDLTDFEPDLTDDDVQSIESYNDIDPIDEIDEISRSVELKYIVNNRESFEDNNEGQNSEETIEEVASDSDITPISPQTDFENEKQPVTLTSEHPLKLSRLASNKLNSGEIKNKTSKSRMNILKHIECKKHCINSLDSNLELCIRKLQINEKLPQCPTLKLQKRYCCIDNTCKNEQKLPHYSGLKSEYGLTQDQWTKKNKTNELARVKIQKRQEISEQFKKRKIQQNEQIFSEWLRNLKYKKQNIDPEILRKYYIPSNFLMPTNRFDSNNNSNINSIESVQNINRPKTSSGLPSNNRNLSKRAIRPSTSHQESRDVFIEIPPEILNREVQLGNLVISSIKNNGNNTITIVAVKNQ